MSEKGASRYAHTNGGNLMGFLDAFKAVSPAASLLPSSVAATSVKSRPFLPTSAATPALTHCYDFA